jgi:carbamoyl-phosphate synthase large subunit
VKPLVDTLLVTGCGGDIALSIARFVREDGLAERIVGADSRDEHPGFAFFDAVERLPPADDDDYLAMLDQAAARHAADLILPMSEAELGRLLAAGRIGSDPRLLTANAEAVAVGLDKLETFRRLDAGGVSVPRTGIVGETEPVSLPCIIKLRRGQGSKGVVIAESWNVGHLTETRAGDLWQDYLPDATHEYTCGLFRSPETGTRSIVLRRQLVGGLTGSAIVVEDAGITAELDRIADILDLHGAINVQLRVHAGRPYVFEINARFSSTVGFRHRLGFRDFLWSLERATGKPISAWQPVPAGTRMFRVGQEIIQPVQGRS